MFKSVIYKEWIKTKWYVVGILLVSIIIHAYLFMKLEKSIRLAGIVHLWDVIINKDIFFFRDIKLLPLLSGIVLGFAQYTPEMYQKRLKLALHLPLPSYKIIRWYLIYGTSTLLLIFGFSTIILLFYMRTIFAFEFISTAFFTIIPWYLAGVTAYFLSAWICLEPIWSRRVINTLISIPIIYVYMLETIPAAYSSCVLMLLFLTILTMTFINLSVIRFKNGK